MNLYVENKYWTFLNLRKKVWFWLAIFALALTAYHQDAIRGQWKFERLCKEEGGARYYGKIERGQGWVVEDKSPTGFDGPFAFGDVAFVRYTNAKGEQFDVTKKPGTKSEEYIFSLVDEMRIVRYKFMRNSTRFKDDERFSSTTESIADYQTGALLASFTSFGYPWTKPERVLFAASTGQICEMLGYDNINVGQFIKTIFGQGH